MNEELLANVKRLSKVSKDSWEYLDGRKDIYDFGEAELEHVLDAFDEAMSIIRAFLVVHTQKKEAEE